MKSNRVCAGYHREFIFTDSDKDRLAANAESERSSPKGPKTAKERCPAERKTSKAQWRGPGNRRRRLSLPASPDPGQAHQAQVLGSFLEAYLPEGEKQRGCNGRQPISWIQVLSDIADPGDALSPALAAISLTWMGRLHRDQRASMEAKALYLRALSNLQKALWDKSRMYRDETLAACMALETYEVNPPDQAEILMVYTSIFSTNRPDPNP